MASSLSRRTLDVRPGIQLAVAIEVRQDPERRDAVVWMAAKLGIDQKLSQSLRVFGGQLEPLERRSETPAQVVDPHESRVCAPIIGQRRLQQPAPPREPALRFSAAAEQRAVAGGAPEVGSHRNTLACADDAIAGETHASHPVSCSACRRSAGYADGRSSAVCVLRDLRLLLAQELEEASDGRHAV
jgi:hypothetical protein